MKYLLITFLIFICNAVVAETNVNIFAGFRGGGEFEEANTGKRLKIKDGESIGFEINWSQSADTMIELVYSHQESQLTNSSAPADVLIDLDVDYLHIGGIKFWPGDNIQPYLVGTAGVTYFNPEFGGYNSKMRGSIGFGVGTKINPSKKMSVKLEARGYSTFLNGGGSLFCNESGCRITAVADTLWQYEFKAGLVYKF